MGCSQKCHRVGTAQIFWSFHHITMPQMLGKELQNLMFALLHFGLALVQFLPIISLFLHFEMESHTLPLPLRSILLILLVLQEFTVEFVKVSEKTF